MKIEHNYTEGNVRGMTLISVCMYFVHITLVFSYGVITILCGY